MMIHQRRRDLATAFLATDLVATLLAFGAAYHLRFFVPIVPVTKGLPDAWEYVKLVPLLIVVWPIVYYFHGLYDLRPGRSRIEELSSLVFAAILGTIVVMGLLSFYRDYTYSRVVLAFFIPLDVFLVVLGRWLLRAWLERLFLRGQYVRRVLLAGCGDLAQAVAERVFAHRELGLELVGWVDEDSHAPGAMDPQFERLGRLGDVAAVIRDRSVDQIFLALPLSRHEEMLGVIRDAGKEGVDIKVVPDLLEYIAIRAGVEDLDGVPIINLTSRPLDGWNSLAKRTFDLVLASTLLVLLAPVGALIALAIWIESRGPLFYRQERMGLDGKPFEIRKFRSMVVDAERESGAVFATANDDRRTRVGKLLREWSLDELPQLVNVLEGDMSLVGPRPERPEFVARFKERVPQYMLRHKVRAGITGWAQVNGWRGNTSIEKRIEYDLYYIENWSLAFDLKILWMTVRQGFRNENAY
jgi:exopolysaccharide biosynthesis polyprenyl glycosylphosphotransferase